jgi:hypothetical protein
MHAVAANAMIYSIKSIMPSCDCHMLARRTKEGLPFCGACAAHLFSLRAPSRAHTEQVERDLTPRSYTAASAYNLMQKAIASNDSTQTLCQLHINAVVTGEHERMQDYMKPGEAPSLPPGSRCMMAYQR